MKAIFVRPAVCVAVILAAAVVEAQTKDQPACTQATLNGAYGLIHDGVIFGPDGHLAEIGIARFDGQGAWSLDATLVSQGSGLRRVNREGTYTVNPDCTGSSAITGPEALTFEFIVFERGKALTQLATRTDRAVMWELKKQDVVACSNATLSGRYGILQTGADPDGNARSGAGIATFDGTGGWSLVVTEVKKNSPLQHISNPNGTYAVTPDCRGSASLANTPFGVANWEFVIVDGGREVFQIVTTPPRGTILWTLRRQFAQ